MDNLSYMISGSDIKNIFPEAKLIPYNNLKHFNPSNYKKIFDNGKLPNFSFILYESDEEQGKLIGHWVLIIDYGNTIEVFDPYGEDLEEQYDEYQGKIDKHLKQKPYLEILMKKLKKLGKKIVVNPYKFQKESPDINTCGKWCIIRAIFENLNINQFKDIIKYGMKKSGLSSDELIGGVFYKNFGK